MANRTKSASSSKKSAKKGTSKPKSAGLATGMRLEVMSLSLVEPTLKRARARGARLCGGTNTCLALVDVSTKSQPGK